MDQVNKTNAYSEKFKEFNTGIETSNPCSEAFLRPYESCVLGSINLYHLTRPFWTKEGAGFSEEGLKKVVELAVDFLNAVVDKTVAPLPDINRVTRESRKIGLGVMGLADMLSALGLRYDSEEGRVAAAKVLRLINESAESYSLSKGYKNAMLTLIAPTGTTGLVANVSAGIEPHFRILYTRHSQKVGDITMLCRSFGDMLAAQNLPKEDMESLLKQMSDNKGRIPRDMIIKSSDGKHSFRCSDLWPTADQIVPLDHLKMLATVQQNVHNGVSKTINLPNSATEKDIEEAVMFAWKNGIKGMTVYRDGSREVQVISEIKTPATQTNRFDGSKPNVSGAAQKEAPKAPAVGEDECTRDRPSVTHGCSTKVRIGCGNLYITTNSDESGPCEVFTNLGRAGGCPSQSGASARLISLCLRSGIPVEDVTDQLVGIRCLSTIANPKTGKTPDGKRILSCPDAIGKCLNLFSGKSNKAMPAVMMPKAEPDLGPQGDSVSQTTCPNCGEKSWQREGKCGSCPDCGYSKCG